MEHKAEHDAESQRDVECVSVLSVDGPFLHIVEQPKQVRVT